jgi:hypothetical protein
MSKIFAKTFSTLGGALLLIFVLARAAWALDPVVIENGPKLQPSDNPCIVARDTFAAAGFDTPLGSRYDLDDLGGIIPLRVNPPGNLQQTYNEAFNTTTETFFYTFKVELTSSQARVTELTPINDEVQMSGGGGWELVILRGSQESTLAYGINQKSSGWLPLPRNSLNEIIVCQVPGPSGFTTFEAMRAAVASFNAAYPDPEGGAGDFLRTADYILAGPTEHVGEGPARPNFTGADPIITRFCDGDQTDLTAFNRCINNEPASGFVTRAIGVSGSASFLLLLNCGGTAGCAGSD